MRRWMAVMVVLVSEAAATAAAAYALATPAHDQVPLFVAQVLAIAGPAVVAWRRRSASWLLMPLLVPVALAVYVQVSVKVPDPATVRAQNAAAHAVAAQVDAALAYQPPALPGGPARLPAARRAFDAALDGARPRIAGQGIRLAGERTYRGDPPGEVVMLELVASGTRVCVWYHTTDPDPHYARGGAC